MSPEPGKQTRSQMPAVWVIALTLCAGGAVMALGPIKQRLGEARVGLNEAQDIAARAGELTAGKPIMQIEQGKVRSAIETIEQAGAAVIDPAALVSRINTLASETGVIVDRVSPRRLDASKTDTGGVRPDAVVTTTVQATGNFQAMTAFIGGLESQPMIGGVQSVRLSPMLSHGTSELRATIEMTHAAFSMPSKEELAAMALSMQGVTP